VIAAASDKMLRAMYWIPRENKEFDMQYNAGCGSGKRIEERRMQRPNLV